MEDGEEEEKHNISRQFFGKIDEGMGGGWNWVRNVSNGELWY
jgi:hypothetical protein